MRSSNQLFLLTYSCIIDFTEADNSDMTELADPGTLPPRELKIFYQNRKICS